jgi:hypothetical protein
MASAAGERKLKKTEKTKREEFVAGDCIFGVVVDSATMASFVVEVK